MMPCWRCFLIAALAGPLLVLAGLSRAAEAATPPEVPFEARLDEAVKQLAGYDFGEKSVAFKATANLVAATRGKPAERKQLAVALADLLPDENLSHMARYALEQIPGPAADEALRRAIGTAQGKLRVGMINSLGNRRSQSAVDDLSKLLGDSDVAVACAAAAALGKIGPAAAPALEKTAAGAPPAVQRAVAEASLRCADALVAEGKRQEAVTIYDRLRQADVPKACRIAATQGAILARQAAGTPVLAEQVKAGDPELFGLALSLVRYENVAEFTAVAIAELDKAPPDRQVRLVEALGDRGDKAALPAVLRLAKEGDAEVRPAAIQALGKLGDAALAPALLEWAAGGDGQVARAAASSLATMADKRVDSALLAALEGAEGKRRAVVFELLGQRRTAAATPALLKAAADADPTVRRAAVKALADTSGPQDVPALLALVLKAKDPDDLAALHASLGAVCARMRDREAFVQQLAAELPRAGAPARAALLNSLGQVGGAKALEAVAAGVKDADVNVANAALHVLSEWRDATAAPQLLAIAKNSENRAHKALALRGYVGMVGRPGLPQDKKLEICREAWLLSGSPEEKRLVLGALGGIPTVGALDMVAPCLDDTGLKDEAAAAAVTICERLGANQSARVASTMKNVLARVQIQHLRDRAQELLDRAEKKK